MIPAFERENVIHASDGATTMNGNNITGTKNIKQCHKNMYGYGNMEVRNNGSDAMTALPPTKLESAA
jgi:hypothetical protein